MSEARANNVKKGRHLYAVLLGVAVALPACGTSHLPAAPQDATDQASLAISPDAKSRALLYVANAINGTLAVYSYPQGALLTTINGFSMPNGLCVDPAGDVFLTDVQSGEIYVFTHGGTKPIRTLTDANQGPVGCSVDPTTGNLAVANDLGSVAIYKKARGVPRSYDDPNFADAYYCSFDSVGTLFVDGLSYYSFNSHPLFAELHRDGKFKEISLDKSFGNPGQVQWIGKYFAVGDTENGVIDHVYVVHSYGVIKGQTQPLNTSLGGGFWIQGKTLINPSLGNKNVAFFKYPAGGNAFKTITDGISGPYAAVVSPAQTSR